MPIDKRARYRQRMAGLGLVQTNEWVPSDLRLLFKAVAQALRDRVPVTIGEVARDPEPAPVARDPEPAPVARDLGPAPVARDLGPAPRAKPAPKPKPAPAPEPVPRDPTPEPEPAPEPTPEPKPVPRDPAPEPEPKPVPRDPEPDYSRIPRTVEELLARRVKRTRKPPSTDPAVLEAKARKKAKDQERQARYAAEWSLATEQLRVINPSDGKGYDARVRGRERVSFKDPLRGEVQFVQVTGVILKGSRYQALSYKEWPEDVLQRREKAAALAKAAAEAAGTFFREEGLGYEVDAPMGWRWLPEADIAVLRKRVRDAHPDKGGPGGEMFKAAKQALDRAVGRV